MQVKVSDKTRILLDKAKINLLRSEPFFSSILMTRQIIWSDQIPTACIDKRAQIRINPTWFEKLRVPQAVFLLVHECWHVAKLDFIRVGSRNPKKWNTASDAWINQTCISANIGEFIPEGIHWKHLDARDYTTEQLYDMVKDEDEGQGGIGPDLPDGMGDEGEPFDADSAEGKEIIAQVKMDVAAAAHAAASQGKMTAELRDFINQTLAPKLPWNKILEDKLTKMVRSPKTTWARPNRRMRAAGYYFPSAQNEPALEHAVVQFDVSGSITQELMSTYTSHVQHLMTMVNPRKLTILWVDTEVKHEQIIEWPDPCVIDNYMSMGGTDMEEGMRHISRTASEDPDVFICLTDGYTSFTEAPSFPVIWCLDNETSQPTYGDVIHIN